MSLNENALQNVWQHHFPEPCGGGGRCGTNWPTEIVEKATLYEFEKNDRFSSLPPVTLIWVTLSDLFYTFHHKKDTKDGF
jgi:hypothetical protein